MKVRSYADIRLTLKVGPVDEWVAGGWRMGQLVNVD